MSIDSGYRIHFKKERCLMAASSFSIAAKAPVSELRSTATCFMPYPRELDRSARSVCLFSRHFALHWAGHAGPV